MYGTLTTLPTKGLSGRHSLALWGRCGPAGEGMSVHSIMAVLDCLTHSPCSATSEPLTIAFPHRPLHLH
jgi:hypothetical protein